MTFPDDPRVPSDDEPIAGEPLIVPPVSSDDVGAPLAPSAASAAQPSTPTPTEQTDDSEGGGKVKAAALLTGAAALANKVRQEAPKRVRAAREKRLAGRCVIVTEADGRSLAIGPYKNEEAAREDLFKVGGVPRVIELVSETAFFEPHETP